MDKRLVWGDWARIIGLYFVVLGHFFPGLIKSFIYSFHVPFFFFISGYFSHNRHDGFWQHLLRTLIVPYFLICMINVCFERVDIEEFLPTFANVIFGFHGLGSEELWGGIGCNELWFAYTLILIKIICHFMEKQTWHLALSVLFVAIVYAQNQLGYNVAWSVTDVFICFPFFVMGEYLKKIVKSEQFRNLHMICSSIVNRNFLLCCLTLLNLVIQYILSYMNGVATLVVADYGKNIVLFYFLGFWGSLTVILMSKLKMFFRNKTWVRTLAMGSILILGFHIHLVGLFRNVIFRELSIPSDYGCYFASFLILLFFLPISYFCLKYLPFLIGKKYEI